MSCRRCTFDAGIRQCRMLGQRAHVAATAVSSPSLSPPTTWSWSCSFTGDADLSSPSDVWPQRSRLLMACHLPPAMDSYVVAWTPCAGLPDACPSWSRFSSQTHNIWHTATSYHSDHQSLGLYSADKLHWRFSEHHSAVVTTV